MLTVKLICAGRMREKFYIEAYKEYAKRLTAFCKWEEAEINEVKTDDNASPAEIDRALSREADEILEKIPQGAFVIAMCVEGKKLSSPGLAELIERQSLSGVSKVCFVVGSSNGLHQRVKQRADFRLSMSDMTFPHHLFRVMLAEQIYRAFTITAGRKYHK